MKFNKLFLAGLISSIFGVAANATVALTALDEMHNPISNKTIYVNSESFGQPLQLETDFDGKFELPNQYAGPADLYSLTFSLDRNGISDCKAGPLTIDSYAPQVIQFNGTCM